MTLEGINFSKEQDDSKPTVENTRFSSETLRRFQRFLSSRALRNTVSEGEMRTSEDSADHRKNEE